MMLLRTIKTEMMKQKRSPIWLAFIFVPIIPAVMGTFNYLQSLELLKSSWYSLWSQHSFFMCYLFLPALLAVYCAWLWRIEHFQNNWNMLLSSPVPFAVQYGAKLLSASGMVILTQVWIGVLFVLLGKLAGITEPIPASLFFWLFCGVLGGIAICAMQLLLSLVIRSFAVPVVIALLGGFIGLLAMAKGKGIFVIYALNSIGMQANNPQGGLAYDLPVFLLVCVINVVLLFFLSVKYAGRRDM